MKAMFRFPLKYHLNIIPSLLLFTSLLLLEIRITFGEHPGENPNTPQKRLRICRRLIISICVLLIKSLDVFFYEYPSNSAAAYLFTELQYYKTV